MKIFDVSNSFKIYFSGHPGVLITFKKIQETYFYVPKHLIEIYIKQCDVCILKRIQKKPKACIPTSHKGPMDNFQIDLIDMRSQEDLGHKWIIHAKCHVSKFTWAKAVTTKECHQVCKFIRTTFYQFGPPNTLQCDNGAEFIGSELKILLQESFPQVKVVHSRPRHPQTNGLIERGNQTLEARIAAYKLEYGNDWSWSQHLEKIVYEINTSYCRVLKATPFKLMFNKSAHPQNILENDEEIDEAIIHINEGIESAVVLDYQDGTNENDPFVRSDSYSEVTSENDEEIFEEVANEEDLCQADANLVLFEKKPPKVWAIAKQDNLRYNIVKVISNDHCHILGNRGLLCKESVEWPKQLISKELGDTINQIESRIPYFLNYLKDRREKGIIFEQYLKSKVVSLGDFIGMTIPDVDRSKVCPRNLICKVIERKEGGNLKLQTINGIIKG